METISGILVYLASASIILGIFLPTAFQTGLLDTGLMHRFNFWKIMPITLICIAAYYGTSLTHSTLEETSILLLSHLSFMLTATGICGILSLEQEYKKSFGIFAFVTSAIILIASILIRHFS